MKQLHAGICWLFFFLGSAALLAGQTQISLRTQAKDVDFSTAGSTRPIKTGASLPATCSVGDMYFKSDAAAGQNLYGCIATNTWAVQSGSGSVASVFGRTGAVAAAEGDYSLVQLSDVTGKQGNGSVAQMFGGGSPAVDDCAKFDANGNIVSAGSACFSGGIVPGAGITTSTVGGSTTVAIDTAVIPAYALAAAALNFPNINAHSCSELTLALAGAAVGDSIAAGWPGALEVGLTGSMRVTAADTVTVRLCNITAAALDPASNDFKATVVRSF